MLTKFVTAISLLLVIEGILLFASPARFKEAMSMLLAQPEKDLRLLGFFSMAAGALLLFFFK